MLLQGQEPGGREVAYGIRIEPACLQCVDCGLVRELPSGGYVPPCPRFRDETHSRSAWRVLGYFLIPALVVRYVWKERVRDHGLSTQGFGDHAWIYVLSYAAVFVGVMFVARFIPHFTEYYPFYGYCSRSWFDLVSWELLFGAYGESYLGIAVTVGGSLIGVVLWGTLAGSMLPFVLRRLGLDPASASAPLVATLVDVSGVLIYFSVARLVLFGGAV